ncbi:MAG: sugar ABC transporter substrate-binding protein [Candidatus Nanopelagicales bacterium]
MKRINQAGAVAGLALLLSACSSGSDGASGEPAAADTGTASPTATTGAAEGGELLIWGDKFTGPVMDKQCQAFAKANGVTCKVVVIDEGLDAILKASTTGDVPDLFTGAHDWLGSLVANGVIAPIDLTTKSDQFSAASLAAVKYEGTGYGVPFAVENVALLMNTDLAAECPATLDELVSTGLALKKSKKATLPLALQISDAGDPYHWYPLFSSDGGYIFGTNADGSYNADDLGIGKEGSIAAAKRLADLADQGVVKATVTGDIALESFSQGASPYYITGPWNVPAAEEKLGDKLRVCTIPAWKGSEFSATPFTGVQTFYETMQAKNAAIAQTFLSDYVATTEFMDAMYEANPRPPAWNETAERKAAADPNMAAFIEQGKVGIPMPAIPAMGSVWGDLGLAQSKIASGSNPEKTIVAAGASIRKQIDEAAAS